MTVWFQIRFKIQCYKPWQIFLFFISIWCWLGWGGGGWGLAFINPNNVRHQGISNHSEPASYITGNFLYLMGSRNILGCHNRVDAAGKKVNTVMIDQLLTGSTARELVDCLPVCGSSNGQRVTSARKLVMAGLAHLLFFQTPIHLNREWISLAWP